MYIKFSNGKELPIVMCYSNGKKYIHGETRHSREIVLTDTVIDLVELKTLLSEPANLSVIEVVGNDGEVEVLENFVYAAEIKDKMNGEIWFTIGKKTALEVEHEEALHAIDTLLIAMEV